MPLCDFQTTVVACSPYPLSLNDQGNFGSLTWQQEGTSVLHMWLCLLIKLDCGHWTSTLFEMCIAEKKYTQMFISPTLCFCLIKLFTFFPSIDFLTHLWQKNEMQQNAHRKNKTKHWEQKKSIS